MLTGLRASDAATLTRLCGADQKLFLRVGMLLQAKLALTEPALAEIVAEPRLTALLLDKRMRTATADEFAALLAATGSPAELLLVDAEGQVEPGWRVVALADELGNPLLATPGPARSEPIALSSIPSLANLSPALRGPVEGLLHASADDQRAAALEQLRYAAPPLEVVGELMPMLLADAADLVRERAINLLVAAGAHVTVIDLIRALTRADHPALSRLGEPLARLPALQRDVAVSALMGAVGRGQVHQALVDLCEALAEHLAQHRGLDRLLELLLPTRVSLVRLVRALQAHDAPRLASILHRALGQGVDSDVQAIILLAGPGQRGDDALLERGLDLLLSATDQPAERMALAAALRRLDPEASLPLRLAGRGAALGDARDTSVYWLIAEYCRDGAVAAGPAEVLARTVRKLLREGGGPHIVAILEHQLPALLPASDAARGATVEPLGESVARFRDERTRDLVLAAIAAIGAPAVEPLWRLLEEHPHPGVRLLAARALPDLLAAAPAPAAAGAVDRLLAQLARTADAPGGPAERAALLTAAARVACGPALADDPAPTARVDAVALGLGELAIDALGWLAGGPHLDPLRRVTVLEDLLAAITAELPDTPLASSTDAATQDITFVIDTRLGEHTENVPRILAALARMGASTHLPPQLLRRLVDRLCHQWQLVSSWRVVWGPGNIQELGKVLGLLARRPDFPGPLRIRICEALLPRIGQLSVARSLAAVFADAEGSYLSDLAGRAGETLLKLAGARHFADDEEEELAEVLVEFLAIPHLGGEGDSLRRRLAGQLTALRNRLGGRGRVRLREVMGGLDEGVRARLEWVGSGS